MTEALRAARERGDVASALYPFRAAFYARLGYGRAGTVLQYLVEPGALPDSAGRHNVELLDDAQRQGGALELYGRWARAQNGQLERGERLWASLCDGERSALFGYRAAGGALEGYALVEYRADLPPGERRLEVAELVWTSTASRRGLCGWLASMGDQWERVLLRALPSHRFEDWIPESRLPRGAAPAWRLWSPAAALLTGPMFRLLDVRAAWERRTVAAGPPLAVALELTDDQVPENAGRWRLVLDGGRVVVERDAPAELTLRLDIAALSRLYIGSLPPSAAFDAGLLDCDRPDLLPPLDAALALPEPWTFDRF